MTRKDYILLAGALNKALVNEKELNGEGSGLAGGVRIAARAIANALATDNARFKSKHFMSVVLGEKDLNSRAAR